MNFSRQKIVIAEDHRMFRELLRKVCVADLDHDVVAEAESGIEAVHLILRHRPDIIFDLSLPILDGFSVIDRVRAKTPHGRFLVLSSYTDPFTLLRIEKSGVNGFVDKNTGTPDTLRVAIKSLGNGRNFFSETFIASRRERLINPSGFEKLLSDRQQEVLSLIAEGQDDSEMGKKLKISFQTARAHRRDILRLLQITSTPKLIVFAIAHGFGKLKNSLTQIQRRS